MKTWSVPILILFAFGLPSCSSDVPEDNTPVTGLPWQIELLPDGNTRVFGIIPGRTTLAAAMQLIGGETELAIIAAPGEGGALEAYAGHYSAGPVTGRLILVMDMPSAQLGAMRERAQRGGASRRFHLHPDDLETALQAPVRVITFVPSLDLDETIVRARFGTPAAVVNAGPQQHWLYPEKGLDLVLDPEGGDVLQYLAPGAFAGHRQRLQAASR